MYELEKNKIDKIKSKLEHLIESMDFDQKKDQLEEIDKLTSDPDLWNNADRAKSLLQEQQVLKKLVTATSDIIEKVNDLVDLISLGAEEKDESISEVIQSELEKVEKAYDQFEFLKTLSGELDGNNAYISIHSGAGGTEACDWVSMLLRMYLRWSEDHDMKTSVVDFLDGDGAGYKSVTLHIEGDYAFGYLKAERGVHRLVRISPFDSNKRRHTSFASVDLIAEVSNDIEIEIDESDLRVDTYRASGAGGQHINKTDSAVRITHLPTGTVVACQNERSQHKNRSTAMKMLKAKMYQIEMEERDKKASENYAKKQKIEWGSQIRSYVLHPYNLVKDLRTNVETSNTTAVLDGDIDKFIEAYLRENVM